LSFESELHLEHQEDAHSEDLLSKCQAKIEKILKKAGTFLSKYI
jgi:hypothetical protein